MHNITNKLLDSQTEKYTGKKIINEYSEPAVMASDEETVTVYINDNPYELNNEEINILKTIMSKKDKEDPQQMQLPIRQMSQMDKVAKKFIDKKSLT